jgi:hypothetical protein
LSHSNKVDAAGAIDSIKKDMSYTVLLTVTDCETGKPLQSATVTDGQTTGTTDKNGQVNFEVVGTDDDPDPVDTVRISATNYGPQYAGLGSNLPALYICLQTLTSSPPQAPLPKPSLPSLNPQPANLKQGNRIAVSWTAPQSYNKYLIWWTLNGVAMPQGEVDAAGKTGSWTASTTPGSFYTFKIDGGAATDPWGDYQYSGWGPAAGAKAVPNLTSLRAFLEASGINLPQQMRSLMSTQSSLRNFMKLA